MKRPVGRPTKYLPEYCEAVIEHMREGASLTSFAAEIGVARSTIDEWRDVHSEFSGAIEKAKAVCAAWWEKLGRDGARGGQVNPTLVIFGLKNMAADDWRDRKAIDHTSSDGSMSPKGVTAEELSDDDLASIAAGGGARADKKA